MAHGRASCGNSEIPTVISVAIRRRNGRDRRRGSPGGARWRGISSTVTETTKNRRCSERPGKKKKRGDESEASRLGCGVGEVAEVVAVPSVSSALLEVLHGVAAALSRPH